MDHHCPRGQSWMKKQLWEEFYSNPLQWQDNRNTKKNPEVLDFQHRSVAEKVLWINDRLNPPWVHVRLAGKVQGTEQKGSSFLAAEISGKVLKVEQLWEQFFADPSQWSDSRFVKKNPKFPDFRHKTTHVGLWIEGWLNPPWVKARVSNLLSSQMGVADSLGKYESVRKLCQEGLLREAVHSVQLMVHQNILPPVDIYACLLQGCTKARALAEGKRVHVLIVNGGLNSNIFLCNSLVHMYAKCGNIVDARQVFDSMPDRNVFSWTIIISAYANHRLYQEAIDLFQKMQQKGVMPNRVAFTVVLKACARIHALELGKQLHVEVVKLGFDSDMMICNTLLDMYAKCGCLEDARHVFDGMHERSVVSWTAMLAGYVEHGLEKEALTLYKIMKEEGIQPDYLTYVVLLKACASISALEEGKQLHLDIIRQSLDSDLTVQNTLIDMYAKCGQPDDAQQVFNTMPVRSVVSWNVMITVYAQQGLGERSVDLFNEMQREGIKPSEVTFVNVLSACSRAGLVDIGLFLFDSMIKDHGIVPSMDHYACVVDLLGRAGNLASAEEFISQMPIQPDAVIWMALLSAATNHGDVEVGRRAFECVRKLEPENAAAPYVLLSKIYSAAGMMDAVSKITEEKNAAVSRKL